MNRSQAGIAEVHVLSKGALPYYIVGSALPTNSYRIAAAIASNKELSSEPYDPPTDLYNNKIHSNGKRNFKIIIETLQASLQNMNLVDYMYQINGGVDALFIPEGFERYEGNSSGIPTVGGGTYWLKNPSNGIWFFDYANRNHFGLDYEFKIEDKSQSILMTLEAAVSTLKAKNLALAAQTNIIKESAVAIPDYDNSKQYILELKEVEYYNETTSAYVSVFDYDDIDSFSFNLKTVTNKQTKDNRSIPNLGELNVSVVGSDASCSKINSLWNLNQFAKIRLTLTNPYDGLDYYIVVSKNTISNVTDPYINKEKRNNTFKLSGQFPITRLKWYIGTTRTLQIGF